jgi:hypothetical protein
MLAVPRTADGRPDLQGTWNFGTATPFQRPAQFRGRDKLTGEEAAKLERDAAENQFKDAPKREGTTGNYNRFWFETGTKVGTTLQTSVIVDPPDGQLPALTVEARRREDARIAGREVNANPEDISLWERCIVGFTAGPPVLPSAYNNNIQIVQTRDHVLVLNEMAHDARVIPLNGDPTVPSAIRQWMGASRGHWEGDTLVVDSTNFRKEGSGNLTTAGYSRKGQAGPGGMSDENLHVVERFTRIDAKTLQYEFTVEDPTVWTRPWKGTLTMTPSEGPIYEYACHEANYGLQGILAGARAEERRASGKEEAR